MKKLIKFLILVVISISISLVSINVIFPDFTIYILPKTLINQTQNTQIQNVVGDVYIGECKECPITSQQYIPKYLYLRSNILVDQNINFIAPDGQLGVIRSVSPKQTQTIGYCYCDGNKIAECNLFYQFRTQQEIESNYSTLDFRNQTCEERPIPV